MKRLFELRKTIEIEGVSQTDVTTWS